MEPLACSTIVYRAMKSKSWVNRATNPPSVLSVAFMRRTPPKDTDGISVDIDSPESCVSALSKSFGSASLHVGRIRDMGLDVKVDEPPHANIVGAPAQEENRTEAERLAGLLAKQARFIEQPA